MLKKPRGKGELLDALDPLVRKWFFSRFEEFSQPQLYGVMPIHERKNVLISAPTGGTKTLTAFLSIINYLVRLARKSELEDKVYCVYVSPLKALSNDIFVNLEEPLSEIKEIAKADGVKLQKIRVGLRTGDTPTAKRAAMLKKVPHILITTPETIGIVLTTRKFVELLSGVEFFIVDEVHALASNKRGVHLSLSLERLEAISLITPVRIGLSATIAPLDEIAKFLVGYEEGEVRDCLVADVQFVKKTNLKVLCPVPDLIETSSRAVQDKLYGLIDKLIQEHRTTLIFTNTRSATERVINHLKEMFPSRYVEEIGAHHSSLSKRHRFSIEERLREGKLRVVVSSTSLELGIDIGYIDLVILLGSPKSVARALQRTGRAGHCLHDVSKGRFIVLDRDDLVECGVLLKGAVEKKIDRVQIPQGCLDVLSQQIYGMAIQQKWDVKELLRLIRQSYCYHNLKKGDFFSVISYLSGDYAELESKHVYAKIWYDAESGQIGKRGRLARVIYMTNIGTIPEESYVNVKVALPVERREEKIGMVDEGFLERLQKGDVFVLGGHRYEFLYTRGMNAYVNACVKRPPTIPSWFSEMLPLSFDLAMEIQRFRKLVEERFKKGESEKEIKQFIGRHLYSSGNVLGAIYNYFREQFCYSRIPHEKRLLVEHYKDEEGGDGGGGGKRYVVFHSLYGRRVNDALSRGFGFLLGGLCKRDVEVGISDNGFFVASEGRMNVGKGLKLLSSENLEHVLEQAVMNTEMFKRRFRHCATRGLMILRSYMGRTKSVGRQQLKSGFLLGAVRRLDENFPLLRETRREVMEDLMDIENAKRVLKGIENGRVKVEEVHNDIPSPFAFGLIMQGYADILKIEDRIEFLKRMHRAVLARIGRK